MEVSVHQAAKQLGEPVPYAWTGSVPAQSYGGGQLSFPGEAALQGTITGEKDAFRITGEASLVLDTRCARCNEPVQQPLTFSFEERFLRAGMITPEDDAYPFQGDTVDLEQAFMDNLFLNLPMVSLCRPDCKGLCPVCGTNLNRSRCSCADQPQKSAFDALKALSFEK